jgi:hypothetical protein
MTARATPACVVVLTLLCLASAAHGQKTRRKAEPPPRAEVGAEVAADPAFHSIFENERVRVWRLELAAGASTQLDRRSRDYLVLALTPAILEVTAGVSRQQLQMQPEQLEVLKGGWAHKTVNRGAEPTAVIEIEPRAALNPEHAVCGLGAHACRSGEIGNVLGDYTQSVLFETDSALLSKFEVSPGAIVPVGELKHDTLLIAMLDQTLSDRSGSEDPQDRGLTLKAGETAWFTAGTRHAIRNKGDQVVRFLMLEFK